MQNTRQGEKEKKREKTRGCVWAGGNGRCGDPIWRCIRHIKYMNIG
jgi:hypothetical protein